jgi:hypothetical protein
VQTAGAMYRLVEPMVSFCPARAKFGHGRPSPATLHPSDGVPHPQKSPFSYLPSKAIDDLALKLQSSGVSAVLGGGIFRWLVSKLGFVRSASSVVRCTT